LTTLPEYLEESLGLKGEMTTSQVPAQCSESAGLAKETETGRRRAIEIK